MGARAVVQKVALKLKDIQSRNVGETVSQEFEEAYDSEDDFESFLGPLMGPYRILQV